MKTIVVNLFKDKYDVYIGRQGKGHDGYWGNPFKKNAGDDPGSTLGSYYVYFHDRVINDVDFRKRIVSLKGKRLGCFCKPNPCHGDIISAYLNNEYNEFGGLNYTFTQVLKSNAGYYIGSLEYEKELDIYLPYCRDSEEYYTDRRSAVIALINKKYTQKI